MPKYRELVTLAIIDNTFCKDMSLDRLEYVLFNKNILGQYYSFRCSEYT